MAAATLAPVETTFHAAYALAPFAYHHTSPADILPRACAASAHNGAVYAGRGNAHLAPIPIA